MQTTKSKFEMLAYTYPPFLHAQTKRAHFKLGWIQQGRYFPIAILWPRPEIQLQKDISLGGYVVRFHHGHNFLHDSVRVFVEEARHVLSINVA